VVISSAGKARVPLLAGYLLVDLTVPFQATSLRLWGRPGVPGEGDGITGFRVPANPGLALGQVYLQAFAADPFALQGLAMTGGTAVWLGE